MRILHICPAYPPTHKNTPSSIRDIILATRTVESDTGNTRDVRVLTSKLESWNSRKEIDPRDRMHDYPYVQRLNLWRIGIQRLQALSYYIQHHNPDVIHGHDNTVLSWEALIYAKRNRIPYIHHSYTFSPLYTPIYTYSNAIIVSTRKEADILASYPHLYILPSPVQANHIEEVYIKASVRQTRTKA